MYGVYFGYLIPKTLQVLRMDESNSKKALKFRHGLALLYQFIDFILRIHDNNMWFGYLDF